jgi:glycosyltransferase involved in cell wall biosynthesis
MTKMPQRSMRVLMAGPMPPAIGGMTSVLCDLAESRLRETVELRLFDTGKQTPARRSLVLAVRTRLRLWLQWWKLLGWRPDIAHLHTCSGLTFFLDGALLVLARLRGVPVILHVHGGRFDRFLDELTTVRARIARWIARLAARVIVLSDSWRERLGPRLPHAMLTVVENGVPVRGPRPARPPAPPFVVLFLGAINEEKGIEDLIHAAANLRGSVRFVLVGPQDDVQFVARMQRLVEQLELRDSIEFAGPARGAEKDAWLARAHIFVLPSRTEAFPISILEAMESGLPIVATRVGAVPKMIESGRSGLLVSAGDIAGLSVAISTLLSDPALRDRLGVSARTDCIERFSIDRTARVLQDLYAEILHT